MNKKLLLISLLIFVVLLCAKLMWMWQPTDQATMTKDAVPGKKSVQNPPPVVAKVETPKLAPTAVPQTTTFANPAAVARPAGTLATSMSPEQQASRQQKRDGLLQDVQAMQAERDNLLANAASDQERESITGRYRLRISMSQNLADMYSEQPSPPPVNLGVVALVEGKPTTLQVDEHTQATITLQSSSEGYESYLIDISHVNAGGGIVHAANARTVKTGEPVAYTWNFYELHFTPEIVDPPPTDNP